MKKIILLTLGIFAAILSYGQDKGKNSFVFSVDWQVSKITAAGITSTSTNYTSITTGYRNHITEHLRLGVNFGLYFNNNATSDDDIKNIIAPGIDIAWYQKLSEKFFWTPTIGFDYGFTSFKNNDKYSGFTIMPYLNLLSFEFRPCENIGLLFQEFSISYSSTSITDKNTEAKASSSKFSWATTPAIGFIYYF